MCFLRKELIQGLEATREIKLQTMDKAAVTIQSTYRMYTFKMYKSHIFKGFQRTQAAWRAMFYRKKWLIRKNAITILQHASKGFLTRNWYIKAKYSTLVVQRFVRRFMQRVKWLRIRRALRTLHMLSRGFIVRQHVLKMLGAVRTLQRAARDFLKRNSEYWGKVNAALLIQAAWRGMRTRLEREDIVEYLAAKRKERREISAIKKIQATWKMILTFRRLQVLKQKAMILQQWMQALQTRSRFLGAKRATMRLQRVARGMLGRRTVREMRTANMVADMLWRLKTVREREALQLAKMNARPMSTAILKAGGVLENDKKSKRGRPGFSFKLLDVDTLTDSSDIYTTGWTHTFADLDAQLAHSSRRIEQVCCGATHSAVLESTGKVYTWGWGDRGQLGHGVNGNERKPKVIEALFYKADQKTLTGNDGSRLPGPRDMATRLTIAQICSGEDHMVSHLWSNGVFRTPRC